MKYALNCYEGSYWIPKIPFSEKEVYDAITETAAPKSSEIYEDLTKALEALKSAEPYISVCRFASGMQYVMDLTHYELDALDDDDELAYTVDMKVPCFRGFENTTNWVTADSLGRYLPENWERVAAEINGRLEIAGIPEYGELTSEQRDLADRIWNDYWCWR